MVEDPYQTINPQLNQEINNLELENIIFKNDNPKIEKKKVKVKLKRLHHTDEGFLTHNNSIK